ncbi:dipeptidyl-peptidase 5 [Erythrobacter sp.]|jgi:dipeptidyl aminopeptidase/acylaminoacyl peptidase|uniref:dipeptidyl-peptidase 5 n=1 Tax=Erythrobacter sp. TaxID=1042 RepID=UPI002EB090B5|nr:S9 family peptidase [Erythrobacter sp.]
MGRHILTCAALAAALTTTFPVAAQDAPPADTLSERTAIPGLDRPPMTARDLITMPRLGAPVVSRFGRYAIYAVTYTDEETLEREAQHYLLDLQVPGAEPVSLDLGLSGHSLAFGADNHLYFLSGDHPDESAETRQRLWRVALKDGGCVSTPSLLADMGPADIAGFKLSPAGDRIALWGEVQRSCESLACDPPEPATGSGRLYDGEIGFYRHWDHWVRPDVFNRVFVYPLENGTVGGDAIAVDGGDAPGALIANTPTRPFGGGDDIAWAPDGSALYFTARRADANEPGSTDLDIYVSDLSGAAPIELTAANTAYDANPALSPDGRHLAYVAMARPGYESDRTVVHLRDLTTGETRALTADVDLSFGNLTWSHDGSHLLASAADVLDTPVYRIDPASGAVTELNLMAGNEAHIGAFAPLPGGRLLFTRDSIGVPAELFLANGNRPAKPLTDIVTSHMGEMATTRTTRFSFEGAQGDTVWGQITRLENQEGPIPAILYIHGGPQGTFNDVWSSRWNARAVASQGYAVISVDFHGSAGYGQAFKDSINRDWGGKPLEDLQKGLAAALAEDPQIDGTRACAMGASYGGYMVNWIAGQWPERFDCLVQHDGLFDMRSFYYATEELWFPRWDFGGSYAEARDTYERWNPVNLVDKWQTPMLVIAGERDFRVPYTQGLQSFTALQERGIPSQLLVFPDENHWVLGAANSLQWHETVFDWLDRWLGEEPQE